MKNDLRRLKAVLKMFDEKDFYAVHLQGGVSLQGIFNAEKAQRCRKNKFQFSLSDGGYVQFKRKNVFITLT